MDADRTQLANTDHERRRQQQLVEPVLLAPAPTKPRSTTITTAAQSRLQSARASSLTDKTTPPVETHSALRKVRHPASKASTVD